MKLKTLLLALGVVILSISIVTSVFAENAGAPQLQVESEIPIQSQPTQKEKKTAKSESLLQQFVDTEILTVSINKVDISASNFRIEDNKFKSDVCFLSPSKGEWIIFDAHVFFEDNAVIHANGSTTFSKVLTLKNGQTMLTDSRGNSSSHVRKEIPAGSMPDYRCDTLYFNLGNIAPTAKFEMKIDALMLLPGEGEGCVQYEKEVRKTLKARGLNIEFVCEQGQFDSVFAITEKPENLSKEEAYNIVANIYTETLTIKGPWMFSGELRETP